MGLLRFIRRGEIGPVAYGLTGASLMLLKQFLDQAIAHGWQEPWSLWSYWSPAGQLSWLTHLGTPDHNFLLTLACVSLPFLACGVILTMARLRRLRRPLWLVVLFFLPVLNLLFFLFLLRRDPSSEKMPRTRLGSVFLAIAITAITSVIIAMLDIRGMHIYGWGLFLGVPFCLGLSAVLVYGSREQRSLGECMGVAALAVVIPGCAIFLVALEGAGCLAMALPLALPVGLFGGFIGWAIQDYPRSTESSTALALIPLLLSPGLTVIEKSLGPSPAVFQVQTAIEIAAPPEAVWPEVIAFSEITEPREWLFHTGIAYPVRAHIDGSGPGAMRYCEFSTGPFVEPIRVWDEPRLLAFDVTENPAPMRELGAYGPIDTPHLHNYLVSRHGQFLLTRLPNGHTRLEGTTWYSHNLAPSGYWRVWSDYIIHRIHLRVLNHIKANVGRL